MKFPGLEGKTALITGGGSGIGRASAILLAKNKVNIAVIDKSLDNAEETVSIIEADDGTAMALSADVADAISFENAIKKLEKEYKTLHIVFANAGINGTWAPVEELSIDDWDETINVNLRGSFITFKYTLPLLKNGYNNSTRSFIINSSINGSRLFSTYGATAYICSKASQVALAKHLALQYAKYRIRVNVICTGDIETNIVFSTKFKGDANFGKRIIPLTNNIPGNPEDIANVAVFLSSDLACHISGTEIYVDGTESLLRLPNEDYK